MEIKFVIEASIIVPDGSRLDDDSPRMIVLPDGNWIKPFIVMEYNDDRDLSYDELFDMNCDIQDCIIESEIVDNG